MSAQPQLLRRLTTFDIALLTIGSIVGSGIFRTPAAVAQHAHSPALILGCWLAGGAIALAGAFVYAELAARRPLGGGLYAYLRDAYHPVFGFMFGWTLLLIYGTGANAAAAVLFAGYLVPLTGLPLDPRFVAAGTFALLAAVNLLGVRQGSAWQNLFTVLKIAAIAALIAVCLFAHPHAVQTPFPPFATTGALFAALGAAMLPVLFTCAGFQNASFVTAETVEPQRTIPRALLVAVGIVITVYLLANLGYLRMLGAGGLAASAAPAADAMRAAFGDIGGRLIALAIALSVLGYLSTCMLAYPRIYYQMAADGTFFKALAWVSPRARVPAVAILAQAAVASVFVLTGTYEQIVNWVVPPQWFNIALGASTLFVFRKRDGDSLRPAVRVPGHPYTTALFLGVVAAVLVAEAIASPRDTLVGAAFLLSGALAYWLWHKLSS